MVGIAADGDRRKRRGAAAARARFALEVGRAFAEIIRDEPVARELWVTVDTEEPGIHLWLITDPLNLDAQYEFYGLMEPLDERFSREVLWLHLRHAGNTIGDVHGPRYHDAVHIPLRAG